MFKKNKLKKMTRWINIICAIGLFYGAYLMLAIAIFFVVGLIYNDVVVWLVHSWDVHIWIFIFRTFITRNLYYFKKE